MKCHGEKNSTKGAPTTPAMLPHPPALCPHPIWHKWEQMGEVVAVGTGPAAPGALPTAASPQLPATRTGQGRGTRGTGDSRDTRDTRDTRDMEQLHNQGTSLHLHSQERETWVQGDVLTSSILSECFMAS